MSPETPQVKPWPLLRTGAWGRSTDGTPIHASETSEIQTFMSVGKTQLGVFWLKMFVIYVHGKLAVCLFPLFLLYTSTPCCPLTGNIAWWDKKKRTRQHFDLGSSSGPASILFHLFLHFCQQFFFFLTWSLELVLPVGGWTNPVLRKQKFRGELNILQSYMSSCNILLCYIMSIKV